MGPLHVHLAHLAHEQFLDLLCLFGTNAVSCQLLLSDIEWTLDTLSELVLTSNQL